MTSAIKWRVFALTGIASVIFYIYYIESKNSLVDSPERKFNSLCKSNMKVIASELKDYCTANGEVIFNREIENKIAQDAETCRFSNSSYMWNPELLGKKCGEILSFNKYIIMDASPHEYTIGYWPFGKNFKIRFSCNIKGDITEQ